MILSAFAMIANVFSPQLTISYANNNISSMKQQLLSSIKILGIFSCIPMVFLITYGDTFYKLWVPTQDEKLLQILTLLLCLEFVFALPLESLWNIFMVTNRVKQTSIFMFVNSIISIIIVVIALYFMDNLTHKLYVIAGTSTLFSIIRSLTFLPIYGAYCMGLKWFTFYPIIIKNTLAVGIITCISFVIKYFIVIDSWLMLFIAALITVFISLIFNSALILSKEDKKELFGLVVRFFKK